ncbi:hypothetical protein CQ14_06945 [Bradyrhizobium lablabi]|uniref:Uncharacterized protein n=1 Tax=Bradyrhizobium lablabi TaxID=722472 RepID=A0A0R3MTT0_9BRAD|nr:hypothetical protein [Bradyrhizobium lablabi]KRR21381.1 hypothetical protein CQ14_06945 [Bradyrhizobium lablabi]
MSVLVIRPDEEAQIAEAVEKARQNPIPWKALESIADKSDTNSLDLGERASGVEAVRRQYPSQHLALGTYRVALSFEQQPDGLFRHLSISSANRGKVPGLEVLTTVLGAFGFTGWPLRRPHRIWMEEFEPGHHAVNVVELEPPLSS